MPKADQVVLGSKYGRLTLVSELPRQNTKRVFECKCDCGKQTEVLWQNIKKGASTSCGCYAVEVNTTHGMSRTRIRNTWTNMIRRCTNTTDPGYPNYGGRGIEVTPEWFDFNTFVMWANSSGFKEDLTIERQDVNKDYSPDNCYWAPMTTQAANRRKRSTGNNPYIGVQIANSKWAASVCTNGIREYLGVFDTAEKAKEARTAYIIQNKLPHTVE